MNMNTLTNTIQGYYIPYGVFLPVQMYAWLAMRPSRLYGVGPEATAAIALACRKHAQLNPKAFTHGKPLDWDTYHSARRSDVQTSELQSLMRISYAVICLKTKPRSSCNT